MAKIKSKGKCIFCEKEFAKSGIARHLTTHLQSMDKKQKSIGKSFHVRVDAAEMFLDLLVDQAILFQELDEYLRAIWLECCGHMSSFQIKGKHYDIDWDSMESPGEKMSDRVGKVFRKGMNIRYDYDFGSTTQLEVRVMNEYKIPSPDGILLMSRNEPLPILCHDCNQQPAETICSIHVYEGACMFCKSCVKKHAKSCDDFADYAEMPVVNSPRMGVCAYDGGQIDVERDGVWQGE